MEAVKEPLRLLEIEKELAGPGAREAFARHDAVLAALDARIAAAEAKGLTPDEYERAADLREANIVARKILRLSVRVAG